VGVWIFGEVFFPRFEFFPIEFHQNLFQEADSSFKSNLGNHEVFTVREMHWDGKENGE